MAFAVWQVLWQGQLTRPAIVSPPSSGSASPPGTMSTGTSLIPKVGAVVRGPRGGDYLLLQRLNSLPGTFAPSAIEMPDAHAIQLFGHRSVQGSDRWLVAVPAADAANNLALPNSSMTATAPPPSVAPGARLGLPSPFESEVESDTEGEDEQLALSRATYRLRRRVYGKSYGDVWRAVRADDPLGVPLIVKRLVLAESSGERTQVCLAGLREAHFGAALRGLAGLARFLDAFEAEGSLWLVFRDEGVSLEQLLYTVEEEEPPTTAEGKRIDDHTEAGSDGSGRAGGGGEAGSDGSGLAGGGGVTIRRPSALWQSLRREPGQGTIRAVVRQTLEVLARLHARNVTHRDLKPPNIILRVHGSAGGGAGAGGGTGAGGGAGAGAGPAAAGAGAGGGGAAAASSPEVRLADFGSAVDAEVTVPGVGMYPEVGPSVAEETEGYQPPEAALGGEAYAASRPSSYDLWSMGIVILELILGSPHVMPLSKRAEAVLRLRYAEQPEAVMRRLLAANALAEHCILPLAADPAAMARYRGHNGAPCGKEAFVAHVLTSDPLRDSGRHGGALGTAPRLLELLDLAWELLRWRPEDRMSAEQALRHPSLVERVGAEAETGKRAVVGTERLVERAVVGAGVDTRHDWKQALLEITPLLSAPSAAAAAA